MLSLYSSSSDQELTLEESVFFSFYGGNEAHRNLHDAKFSYSSSSVLLCIRIHDDVNIVIFLFS